MPYANEGAVSTSPFDGAIEISDAQYAEAVNAMLEGKHISVGGGFFISWTNCLLRRRPLHWSLA